MLCLGIRNYLELIRDAMSDKLPIIRTEIAHIATCNTCGQDMRKWHKASGTSKGIVTTMVLDNQGTANKHREMYCLGCGYKIFHYYGGVKLIVKGDFKEVKELSRPIDLMCFKCKMVYRVV